MSQSIGRMCSGKDALEFFESQTVETKESERQMDSINRFKYLLAKDVGKKPKFHPGKYGKKYDNWTCGNCGSGLVNGVVANYCGNCGYQILWDHPRTLTGSKKLDK